MENKVVSEEEKKSRKKLVIKTVLIVIGVLVGLCVIANVVLMFFIHR